MRDKLGYRPSTTHNISWQSPQCTLNCQRSTDSSNGGQKAVNVMQTKVLSRCLASPAKIILGPKAPACSSVRHVLSRCEVSCKLRSRIFNVRICTNLILYLVKS